ncbi:MAG: ribosome biogenesis GTP-binding protein YihA/YsxC [Candidatus Sumerlaeaceae bacterium]
MSQAAFVVRKIEFVKSATQPSEYPPDALPFVGFAGRSNVGKSSLLNTLANRKRLALVSQIPGRTRLLNFYRVNEALYFVDLPGYGFAKAPKAEQSRWELMMKRFVESNPRLRAMVALLDVRRQPEGDDRALLDWLAYHGVPIIVALTKADKVGHGRRVETLRARQHELAPWDPADVLLFSSYTRLGREELLAAIARTVFPSSTQEG